MSGHPPMSLSSPTGSLFEPSLDSDGAAQFLRIHPKTLQPMARLTPTRTNVRCSGKWHNRHWHGVGAARRRCRNDSLDWKFISATLLERLEDRDSLAGEFVAAGTSIVWSRLEFIYKYSIPRMVRRKNGDS
jgi:hypothetical protein